MKYIVKFLFWNYYLWVCYGIFTYIILVPFVSFPISLVESFIDSLEEMWVEMVVLYTKIDLSQNNFEKRKEVISYLYERN